MMRKYNISYHVIAAWLLDDPHTENDALVSIMTNLDCDAHRAQEIFNMLSSRLHRVRARFIHMGELKVIVANEFRNKFPEYAFTVEVR